MIFKTRSKGGSFKKYRGTVNTLQNHGNSEMRIYEMTNDLTLRDTP